MASVEPDWVTQGGDDAGDLYAEAEALGASSVVLMVRQRAQKFVDTKRGQSGNFFSSALSFRLLVRLISSPLLSPLSSPLLARLLNLTPHQTSTPDSPSSTRVKLVSHVLISQLPSLLSLSSPSARLLSCISRFSSFTDLPICP
jgi:hypothetical protein